VLELAQRAGRWILAPVRDLLLAGFGSRHNPFNHLGALTIYFFWIVLVSGIWVFIFFRTSVDGAFESVEYLTREQWYLGGVMRSLHRYASDAAIVTLLLHIVREFVFDRHRGARWFSWLTGVPLLWLVIPLGITGYWLVWDQLAWYVALTSAELLDRLPIFSASMASNFLSEQSLSDRFFTLMAFLHLIGLPLFLVFGIWLHVLRISAPRVNPPRGLMAGSLLALLVLSVALPAVSQGRVDMTRVPDRLGLDWFYLPVYPLVTLGWPGGVWLLLVGFSLLLCALPWLPPARGRAPAQVDLDYCNGCARCADDCPFSAITMQPRSDGKAYETEAVVDPSLCVSCGLCTGACPTATPFRRHTALIPGIDLPTLSAARLRAAIESASAPLQGPERILVFGCNGDASWRRHKARLVDASTGVVDLLCAGHLPPSFADFVLSRGLAEGVVLAGCPSGDCQYRLGAEWTSQRMARQRDPHLRKRVDRIRIALAWEGARPGRRRLDAVIEALRRRLPGANGEPAGAIAPVAPRRPRPARWAVAAMAYVAFLAPVAAFSIWPSFALLEPGRAVVSISFTMAGERVGACRTLTQAELDALPPNMRKPTDCPRKRRPLRVLLALDGQPVYEAMHAPTGLHADGAAHVYRRLNVEAGRRLLFVGINRDGGAGEFDHSLERPVELAPGQHLLIGFDEVDKTFRLTGIDQ